jgi:4'-phosphopantetheinyl transferase
VAARAALRALVAALTGADAAVLQICSGPHGKPFLPDGTLRFNLSHSGEVALVALAWGREVGIDVEQLRPGVDHDRLADRYLAPAETAQLRRLPTEERRLAFWHCWVRKEAYLKATGHGMRLGLDRFEMSVWPAPPALRWSGLGPGERERWQLWELTPASGYVGALAAEGPLARVGCWGWDWTAETSLP